MPDWDGRLAKYGDALNSRFEKIPPSGGSCECGDLSGERAISRQQGKAA